MRKELTILLLLAVSFLLPLKAFAQNGVKIHDWCVSYLAAEPSTDARMLVEMTDVFLLNKKMTIHEMSKYLGSSMFETRMVYSFSGSGAELMTPLEFSRFLSEDLFERSALQHFVTKSQKAALRLRLKMMEYAVNGTLLSEEEIRKMVAQYRADSRFKD